MLFILSALILIPCPKVVKDAGIAPLVSQLSAESFPERVAAHARLEEMVKTEPRKMSKLIKEHLKKETSPESLARLGVLGKLAEKAEALLPIDVSVFSKAGLKNKDWIAQLGYTGKGKDWAQRQVKGKQVEIDSTKKAQESVIFCRAHQSKNATHRLTLSFDLKVLKRSGKPSNISGVGMLLTDDKMKGGLFFHEDKIMTFPSYKTHKLDTTDDWHHYRVVGEGNWMKVYIDGNEKPVLTVPWGRVGNDPFANLMLFGDTTGSAGGRAIWRNVTATVHNRNPIRR